MKKLTESSTSPGHEPALDAPGPPRPRDIRSYIATHASPAAADRVRRHLRARADRLRASPFIGVASSNPEIRILPPTRYPYRIYYTVQGDDVVILHVRHTARAAPDDFEFTGPGGSDIG